MGSGRHVAAIGSGHKEWRPAPYNGSAQFSVVLSTTANVRYMR